MTNTPDMRTTLANVIADYRVGEIAPVNVAHVDRWVSQFPAESRDAILLELTHVLGSTYFTRANFQTFIDSAVTGASFVGSDPCKFWQGVKVLDLQTAGTSQKSMITILAESLHRQCGLALASCGAVPHTFLYMDDVLFSGGRIRADIGKWITDSAPVKAELVILIMASHQYGEWDTNNKLIDLAKKFGKSININWQRCAMFENRKRYIRNSDIYCPTIIPDDPSAQSYVDSLTQKPLIRAKGGSTPMGIFSGEAGRHVLEQHFLEAGVRVREMCPQFDKYMRPLGRTLFESLGFGATIVTYRNCPNNTPLVLWAGNPWYPLFPRRTN